MKISKEIDKELWQEFLEKNPGCSGSEFLLSPHWLEILRRKEPGSMTLTVVKDLDYQARKMTIADILGLITIEKKSLGQKFFYWYAARGPILNNNLEVNQKKEVAKFLLAAIWRLDKKALFLKLEPARGDKKFWHSVFKRSLFYFLFQIKKTKDIQVRKTLVLDLKKTTDELLKTMHQKTRYNIRLAKKKGVVVKEGQAADFAEFWRLMQTTGNRDGFRLHSQIHYKNLITLNNDFIKLYFAKYQGKKIATALICFYGKKATYLHGASDYKFRHLMAPYLLQWEIIKEAQARNYWLYDFYGISEKKWPGVTRFKRGFAGTEKVYPGAFDIVFRPTMYRVYKLAKLLRRLI